MPVPSASLDSLLSRHQTGRPHERLWAIARNIAWRHVGVAASPKGLRHGFGIRALCSGVPLNPLQCWLGHADIATTAIHANVAGPRNDIAARTR